MQMFMSIDNNDSFPSENIWLANGLFGDQRSDLIVLKGNFPENALLYANQGVLINLKAGERAIYLDYVILTQILPAIFCPPDIDNYEFEDDEVLLLVSLYNTENGYFKGLREWLGYITICGDPGEQFYSYGYDEQKSKVLYASMKQPLPIMSQGTAFKKHFPFLIESKGCESSSKMFFSFFHLLQIGNKK